MGLPKEYRIGTDEIPQSLYVSAEEANLVQLHWKLLLDDGTEVHKDTLAFNLIKIEFENAAGDDQEFGTSFSHPYPVVELDPLREITIHPSQLRAEVEISGIITDPIADLVPGATINQVFVGFFDENANHPDFNPPHFREIPISVTPLERSKSDLRPHPFVGEFKKVIEVPLPLREPRDVEIVVRSAPNAIGHSGYDSISILLAGRIVLGLENHASSPTGLVNPIRIYITDKSVTTAEQASNLHVEFAEHSHPVVLDGDRLRVDNVFMGLGQDPDFSLASPNLINVVTQNGPTTLTYGSIQRDFHWSYTIQLGAIAAANPANYPKYAAGTTVDHIVHLSLLNTDIKKKDISFQRFGPFEDEIPEVPGALQVEEVEKLQGPPANRDKYRIRIKIGKGTLGPKQLLLRVQSDQNEPRQTQSMPIRGGRFAVVPLKTFIVAVDGLAYERAREIVKKGEIPSDTTVAFPMLFETSPNNGPEDFALSPLPSITHTGWTGVFSGLPPKDHGIQGNSYFSRNIVGMLPFASDGHIDLETNLANLGVVRGTLHVRVKTRASLYENVAFAAGRIMTVWSVHAMYAKKTALVPLVRMNREFYRIDSDYIGHNPSAAETLDRDTATFAGNQFARHSEELDFLTAYFPGPDNMAHAVGAEPTPGYTSGPPVGALVISMPYRLVP